MRKLLLFLTLLVTATLPAQAFDIFMKLTSNSTATNYVGDSTDSAYPGLAGWVRLNSASFSIENTIDIGSTSGGAGAGKATFGTLGISKIPNALSAALFTATATGAHFTEAQIVFVAANETRAKILTMNLLMVAVQKVATQGSSGDDTLQESVELQYGAQDIRFFAQDSKGAVKQVGQSIWSIVRNAAVYEI